MATPATPSLTVTATWQGDDRFVAETVTGYRIQLSGGHGQPIAAPSIQPPPAAPANDGATCTPMEAVLVALVGCLGVTIIGVLQKKRQAVTSYRLRATGVRAETQPTVFTAITVEHMISGQAVAREAADRSLELAETRYCPVSAMLSKSVAITHTITIEEVAGGSSRA